MAKKRFSPEQVMSKLRQSSQIDNPTERGKA